ncbi:hypothetical protein HMI54_011121 [Coelomomyces lativittatus]|nr:hypothetical protein HMI55_001234 [Coelomomyces lativittatus]KAJ1511930.1 hypothetical protein HMI56_004743 [Coelomomyces lativittatus]KAJ1516026.1 hypothetical protein HMI54_011121 [Coelomomyces lativittatus]
MTVVHIVLFKFKSHVSEEAIHKAGQALLALKTKLPDLISKANFSKSFTERHKGYSHALVMEMPSKQALETYSPHPVHQEVVKGSCSPIVEDVLAFDYEVNATS